MNTESIRQQFSLLDGISNYHWWQYVRTDGELSSKDIHVNLHDHLLYHPSCDNNEENLRHKYIPKSPRNRLMYYLYASDIYTESVVFSTVEQLLKTDSSDKDLSPDGKYDELPIHPAKHRKYSSQVVKVTQESLYNQMGVNLTEISNSVCRNTDLYTTFREQLINDGTIVWHQHHDDKDIVVMSDYNPTKGCLTPLSYAHVTCTKGDNNQMLLKCTCHIYNAIQCAALSQNSAMDDEIFLHESMTCMHCRFFKEMLQEFIDDIYNITSTSLVALKIKASLQNINNPIVVMGYPTQNATTKLSVTSEENIALVHISFNQANTCYANCQNGECKARLLNKKKVPKSISISQNTNLCGHIQTVFANFEILENIFPHYFKSNNSHKEDETCELLTIPNESINVDDQPISTENDKVNIYIYIYILFYLFHFPIIYFSFPKHY